MNGRRLWITFLIGMTSMTVAGAMTPLIPLHAVARGASPAMVGIVAASAAILPLTLAVWTGALADALGPRLLTVGGALILAASAVLIASAPTVWMIVVGTAVAGLANNILILANQTTAARASRAQDRDRIFGFYTFWASVGQLTGPLIGGIVADASSTQTALAVSGALAFIPGILAVGLPRTNPRQDNGPAPKGLRADRAYRAAWDLARREDLQFVLFIAFVIVFAWSVKSSFFPLYLQAVGLPKSAIGLVFSCIGGGSMIVRPLIGAASARFGRRRVMLGAVLMAAMAMGVTPFLRQLGALALAAAAAGMAWGMTQPLTMILMVSSVEPHEQGLALSLRMTSNRLAEVISPMVIGVLVTQAGLRSAFFFSAAALVLAVWLIGRSSGRAAFT